METDAALSIIHDSIVDNVDPLEITSEDINIRRYIKLMLSGATTPEGLFKVMYGGAPANPHREILEF